MLDALLDCRTDGAVAELQPVIEHLEAAPADAHDSTMAVLLAQLKAQSETAKLLAQVQAAHRARGGTPEKEAIGHMRNTEFAPETPPPQAPDSLVSQLQMQLAAYRALRSNRLPDDTLARTLGITLQSPTPEQVTSKLISDPTDPAQVRELVRTNRMVCRIDELSVRSGVCSLRIWHESAMHVTSFVVDAFDAFDRLRLSFFVLTPDSGLCSPLCRTSPWLYRALSLSKRRSNCMA